MHVCVHVCIHIKREKGEKEKERKERKREGGKGVCARTNNDNVMSQDYR